MVVRYHVCWYNTDRRSPRIVVQAPGQVPVYIALTGARLSGRDMRATGLATHLVDPANVAALLQRLRGLEEVTPATVAAAVAAHELAVAERDEGAAPVSTSADECVCVCVRVVRTACLPAFPTY